MLCCGLNERGETLSFRLTNCNALQLRHLQGVHFFIDTQTAQDILKGKPLTSATYE